MPMRTDGRTRYTVFPVTKTLAPGKSFSHLYPKEDDLDDPSAKNSSEKILPNSQISEPRELPFT